ncbi:MAG: methylenetetrahydrofolate--tRNA-(uracil(54)-C(5))-methyltransferase (FADH(2)-oxidizing) TrmFO [Anaerolineae bacterium]|nr:methylenetetrahydrofolate--tRNA-(uracil(54)-C(5))-methyltransferase (FADH(2)-oxidizing) TrmFO [Anaerolineae bacterium]
MATELIVIGGGLAGAEAAWQAAQRDAQVILYEMRPHRATPAHVTGRLAELVCSNSLGSNLMDRALGVLKAEMRRLGSLIIACADETALPAGSALAVGREEFSRLVTERVGQHPRIEIRREEVTRLPADSPVIVATGPLTSDALVEEIVHLCGQRHLYFYDAMSPIVTLDSINLDKAYRASRYGRDASQDSGGDYINCPLNNQEYERFVNDLLAAETIQRHRFETEDERFFEGCLPLEVLAARGPEALAYGPLSPMGLRDPRTGTRPHAVVQLRQDNLAGTLYNLVGFQTSLTWPEQKRVFRLIPGLEEAEFVRYGQMHRNTFINSPMLLHPTLQFRERPELFFAGQITGTEGYVGSAAGGLMAGINAARLLQGAEPVSPPRTTMLGALLHYITHAEPKEFQPMKANFGLLPEIEPFIRSKRDRYRAYAQRALTDLESFLAATGIVEEQVGP